MQGIQDALDADSSTLDSILSKAIAAYKAAEAARKARELVRRKSVLTRSALPGKLADCSSTDAASSEIFIVEGDSAGASRYNAHLGLKLAGGQSTCLVEHGHSPARNQPLQP